MVRQTFVIQNPTGLHLKPAAVLCTEAIRYESMIKLHCGNVIVNAKSVLNVLGAGIKCGDEIELSCEGPDEAEALKNLGQLILDGLENS